MRGVRNFGIVSGICYGAEVEMGSKCLILMLQCLLLFWGRFTCRFGIEISSLLTFGGGFGKGYLNLPSIDVD